MPSRHDGPRRRPVFVRASAAGGGIAILLLDGQGALELLAPFFRSARRKHRQVRAGETPALPGAVPPASRRSGALADVRSGDLLFGRLLDASGASVDEVLVAPLANHESETGNAQVELSCHGGSGALLAVEDVLLEAGFSRGRETELLERAHLNGKLSLIALESRRLLARAATARQASFLLDSAAFQQRWERLGFDLAFGMRTGEVGPASVPIREADSTCTEAGPTSQKGPSRPAWRVKIAAAARDALALWPSARNLLAQHHVALIGPVNAGKSTLANRLARAERHIISAIPGTTLDRLDTPVALRGLHLLLSDTAGLRPAADELEREGQRRAELAARSAALRLIVLDGSRPPTDAETELVSTLTAASGAAGRQSEIGSRQEAGGRRQDLLGLLLVLNKCDLGLDETAAGLGFLAGGEPLALSARTGQGLENLERAIENFFLQRAPFSGAPFTRRQALLLGEMQVSEVDSRPEADSELLALIRRLVGTRPNAAELARALEE